CCFARVLLACYVDHLDLHSFPTRRSSDLRCPRCNGLLVLGEEYSTMISSPLSGRSPKFLFSRIVLNTSIQTASEMTRFKNPFTTDRKSTRLNSSHVKISYAVFCLKKKKRT